MRFQLSAWKKISKGITLVVLTGALFSSAYGQNAELWDEDPFEYNSQKKDEAPDPDAPEINEPFFAMVLQWALDDSLGTWSGDDVRAYAEQLGRPSKFPLEDLVSFTRSRPHKNDEVNWPATHIHAIWDIELVSDLDPAMPYSILGYHPGTLRISGKIRMAEVHLGSVSLNSVDGSTHVTDIQLFRLEWGTLVLDVDGWLDALLGKRLDDSAMLGFVAAREDGRLIGLAVSIGNEGRSIYGELDFQRDKVLPNGRAVASALSSACRSIFILGMEDPLTHVWGN